MFIILLVKEKYKYYRFETILYSVKYYIQMASIAVVL